MEKYVLEQCKLNMARSLFTCHGSTTAHVIVTRFSIITQSSVIDPVSQNIFLVQIGIDMSDESDRDLCPEERKKYLFFMMLL